MRGHAGIARSTTERAVHRPACDQAPYAGRPIVVSKSVPLARQHRATARGSHQGLPFFK